MTLTVQDYVFIHYVTENFQTTDLQTFTLRGWGEKTRVLAKINGGGRHREVGFGIPSVCLRVCWRSYFTRRHREAGFGIPSLCLRVCWRYYSTRCREAGFGIPSLCLRVCWRAYFTRCREAGFGIPSLCLRVCWRYYSTRRHWKVGFVGPSLISHCVSVDVKQKGLTQWALEF